MSDDLSCIVCMVDLPPLSDEAYWSEPHGWRCLDCHYDELSSWYANMRAEQKLKQYNDDSDTPAQPITELRVSGPDGNGNFTYTPYSTYCATRPTTKLTTLSTELKAQGFTVYHGTNRKGE